MNAKPRTYSDGELRIIPADGDNLVIECEVANPPSSAGRTVYVVFDVEETVKLLMEAKHAALRARSTPLGD